MKKALFVLFLFLLTRIGFSQDIMTVLPDSTGKELFSDFIGARIWVADNKLNTLNKDLTFKYVSVNTNYVMQHDLNVTNLNNMPNIGLGLEENLGKHLLIHFVDVSFGYAQKAWDWNIGLGAGYFIALDKKNKLRLRASLDLFYESISYSVGSYTDTTNFGFIVNGNNIGTFVQDVKYVNNSFCASLGASIMYRTNAFDYFAGIAWNAVLLYKQEINFYATRVPINQAVYYQSGGSSKFNGT